MQVNIIQLNYFSIFLEYFFGIIIIYVLIVFVLLINNVSRILIQNTISDCFGFILIMGCFLILNDDLTLISFLNNNIFFLKHIGFNNNILTDNLAVFSKFTICFFSSLFFILISDYLKQFKLNFEFTVLLLFAILGLIFMCSSNDLLLMFLNIELVSLSSYLLAAFRKNSSYSIEAGIKYLIIGAISSSFLLLGISFFYYHTGSLLITDFFILFSNIGHIILFNPENMFSFLYKFKTEKIYNLYFGYTYNYHFWFVNFSNIYLYYEYFLINKNVLNHYEPIIEIGLLLIIFSIFIKLGLAPFHLWSLDVYEGSPTIGTFFFAAITKLSFFVFLFRISYSLVYIDFYTYIIHFYCILIGFLSVFVGSFGNLRQKKIKTLLAYSSISHMGYSLLSFGTCTLLGLEMLYFYLVIYMLSNIVIWYVILTLKKIKKKYKNKNSNDLGDIILLNKSNKALAFGLSVVLFSIAGIPPFIGFFAKLGIFVSLITAKFYVVALLSIFCSVISTFYYIRLVKILYFENLIVGKQLYIPINSNKPLIFCLSVFGLIFLFFKPTLLYLVIYKIILTDYNF